MNHLRYCKLITYIIAAWFVASCSTTKVIPEGESRLKANRIIIENSKDYPASNLQPYLKQKPNTSFIFGWNPFLNIYNWSNGKGKGWDKFVTKLGQAPVIFDNSLVESSKTNIFNHLVYDGYYSSMIKDSIVTKNKKSTVYYKVTLGKQYEIDSISYSIADKEISELFFSDTSSPLLRKGDILSENRLEQEIVFYVEKLDINEEKVRLRQHCKYFMETINSEPYPGKKLGFIAQEMGREINTMGSKANHAEIQKWVVKMKDELEKIKEQSLNIL